MTRTIKSLVLLLCLLGVPLHASELVEGCVGCHGTEGRAMIPGWQPLSAMSAETLAGKLRGYQAQLVTDSTMAKVAHNLDEAQIQEVAAWYASRGKTITAAPLPLPSVNESTIDEEWLKRFFLYGALINWAILLYWFVMVRLCRKLVYRIHGHFSGMSEAELDRFNFYAMACYKLLIIVFFFVPWLVLLLLD